MSIYYFDGTQKNPPKYKGIRVAVSVDNQLRQKWFAGEGYAKKKEAEQLDQQWRIEQSLFATKRNRERKANPTKTPYFTHVAGIRMKFEGFIPCFIVSGQKDHQLFKKSFNINRLGFDNAWFKACQYTALKYGLINYDHLITRKPDPRQLLIILNYKKEQGAKITTRNLSADLQQLIEKAQAHQPTNPSKRRQYGKEKT